MPNRSKGRFNGIRGAKTLPVMSRKLEERQQLLPIFLQTRRRFRILRRIDLQKDVEGLGSGGFSVRLPDLVQRLFGFGLHILGKALKTLRVL